MNISNFLDEYISSMNYKANKNGFDLIFPFRFFNDEIELTLNIQKNDDGYYDIDDKGNTLRYLETIDVNFNDYKDRVDTICNLFSLKIDGNVVRGIIGYGTNQTYKQLHNFLQGISHLSTIKYFE